MISVHPAQLLRRARPTHTIPVPNPIIQGYLEEAAVALQQEEGAAEEGMQMTQWARKRSRWE